MPNALCSLIQKHSFRISLAYYVLGLVFGYSYEQLVNVQMVKNPLAKAGD